MELYERRQVEQVTGLTDNLVRSWCEQGFIRPTISGGGTGHRRQFDREVLLVIAVLGSIRELFGPRLRPGGIAPHVRRAVHAWVCDPDPVSNFITIAATPHVELLVDVGALNRSIIAKLS